MMRYQEIIDFWFEEISDKDWWVKNVDLDQQIIERFSAVHQLAQQHKLSHWRENDKGRLAEIIVLDQFSRNMFRGTAQAFASDALATERAQEAVAVGSFERLDQLYSPFIIMPYMHSESAQVHQQAVPLFATLVDSNQLGFELRHKAIIDQFGRYPHRNAILNRASTTAEVEFLKQPGSGF